MVMTMTESIETEYHVGDRVSFLMIGRLQGNKKIYVGTVAGVLPANDENHERIMIDVDDGGFYGWTDIHNNRNDVKNI